MARRPRADAPGAWHHVSNRGLSKRTFLETRADVRYFLSLLARAVRAGEIVVHAFVLMTTHFHLLLESPRGRLSEVMQRVQNLYVRRFNRRRRRDGPLVHGRFWSRPARSERYRRTLVSYFDRNPVTARVVRVAQEYPHGSARLYARPAGPPWLGRARVEAVAREATGTARYDLESYVAAFGDRGSPGIARLIELRRRYSGDEPDPLDDLVGAAPAAQRRWMEWKASLADATKPGIPVVDVRSVLATVARFRRELGPWRVRWTRVWRSGWKLLAGPLLRDLCGCTYAEISRIRGGSATYWRETYLRHAAALEHDPEYRERTLLVTREALNRCHGARGRC